MKNLIYKEFSLIMTPLIYVLLVLFGLFALIPQYPESSAFFYFLSVYPMIFMGANKGTQTNDVYFSLTLPVKRKNIVLARMITVLICQLILIASVCVFSPIGNLIENIMQQAPGAKEVVVGLGFNGLPAMIGFTLVAYGFFNLVFFSIYYKECKKFALPFILAIIPFAIILTLFTIVLPSAVPAFNNIFGKWDTMIQLLTLVGGVIISLLLNYLSYFIASKNFKKTDC